MTSRVHNSIFQSGPTMSKKARALLITSPWHCWKKYLSEIKGQIQFEILLFNTLPSVSGWNDSIERRVFALHVTDPSSIPSTPSGPC